MSPLTTKTRIPLTLAALFSSLVTTLFATDWPAFRGPHGDGTTDDDKAPLHWSPTKNIRWKVPLPGPGNSSPIVSAGRVFITCAENRGTNRNLYCFDRATGTQLWMRSVQYAQAEPTHETNPYCASTPVADGSRVIVWHGSAGVFCYDFEGKELWKTDLGSVCHDWGYASSPLLHRGKIILHFGPGARTFLVALDLLTGAIRWQHDEPGGLDSAGKQMIGSWSTPVLARIDGRDQVLCSMPTRVIACDAETGSLLWFCRGLENERASLVYPSPLISGDVGVAFSGWINGPTIAFKLGGTGDTTATNRLWIQNQTQRIGSGVVVDGRIYIVNSGPGTAQCIEPHTGRILWTERLDGGESWGSVVSAPQRLYVTSRRGVTTVFRANPLKLEILATNDLDEPSHSTPAIASGHLFLRTHKHLYCIADE